jgi:response regulator NasT
VSEPVRVVVAEDEALVRLDLVEMLTELGYDVVGQAGDGERAVELAENLRPDVTLLDVKMPKLDGLAAAERISEQGICAVVMLTAFAQRELVERAVEAGAHGYVVKPFSASDLTPAIEVARARFRENQALAADVSDLTNRLETRKLIDRAKARLQQQLGLSESESFAWLQRTAMDRRTSMGAVAAVVLAELPAPRTN